jgi:hypothetical protein
MELAGFVAMAPCMGFKLRHLFDDPDTEMN